jgi:hypothetical protein
MLVLQNAWVGAQFRYILSHCSLLPDEAKEAQGFYYLSRILGDYKANSRSFEQASYG